MPAPGTTRTATVAGTGTATEEGSPVGGRKTERGPVQIIWTGPLAVSPLLSSALSGQAPATNAQTPAATAAGSAAISRARSSSLMPPQTP